MYRASFYWDSSLGSCVPNSEKPLATDYYDPKNSSESKKPVLRANSHVEEQLNKKLSKEEYDKKLAAQIAAEEIEVQKRAEYYAEDEKKCLYFNGV